MAISFCALLISWRLRKKDFQLNVHREQIQASQKLIDMQFELQEVLIANYHHNFGSLVNQSGDLEKISEEEMLDAQAAVFQMSIHAYNKYLRVMQTQGLILPNPVFESGNEYIEYVGALFEGDYDHDLGVKLYEELYHRIGTTINAVRDELGIDHLSNVNRNFLSQKPA
jgi:hypothetical protein